MKRKKLLQEMMLLFLFSELLPEFLGKSWTVQKLNYRKFKEI